MRRRPEEDDREQVDRHAGELAGDRRPADERRYRARGAPDDDVLRRAALEPDRVDEDVAEEARERQRCREQVHRGRQQQERQGCEDDPVDQGGSRRDATAGHRPVGRARHLRVDVAVEVVVDGARAARRQVAAHDGQGDQPDRRVAGDLHRADGRQQQQRLDLRLGQLDVVADDLAHAGGLGRRMAGQDDGCCGAGGFHGLVRRARAG